MVTNVANLEYMLSKDGIKDNCIFVKNKDANYKVVSIYNKERQRYLIAVEVTNGNEMRPYPADYYLDLLMQECYMRADKATLSERTKMLYETKAEIIHWITRFKHEIANFKPSAEYGFEDTITAIDSAIEYQRVDLEIQKYNLEYKKLKNENKFFVLPIIFSGIALIVSIGVPIIEYMQTIKTQPATATKSGEPKSPIYYKDSLSLKKDAIQKTHK